LNAPHAPTSPLRASGQGGNSAKGMRQPLGAQGTHAGRLTSIRCRGRCNEGLVVLEHVVVEPAAARQQSRVH
jgi:hypothetical protein